MDNLQISTERIKTLCDKNNISINKMLKKSDAGARTYHNMKSGSSPSMDKIQKIAEYFNVSVDYLLGRTDNPEIQKETNNKIDIEQAVLNYIENFNNNSELKAINIFKDGEEQKIVKMTDEQYEEFRKRYGNFND